jgi:hypothetical protein
MNWFSFAWGIATGAWIAAIVNWLYYQVRR